MAGAHAAGRHRPADPEAATAAAAARPPRWRRPIVRRSAFVLAVVGLVVTGALLTLSIGHYDDTVARQHRAVARVTARAELGSSAVDAARRQVIALLTIGAGNSSQDLDAVLAASTTRFHDQLRQQAEAFRQALVQGGPSTSTGSVVAAGLVSLSGRRAVVAVAAKGTLKSAAAGNEQIRDYRLTVTLQRAGSRWLTSDLAFVA